MVKCRALVTLIDKGKVVAIGQELFLTKEQVKQLGKRVEEVQVKEAEIEELVVEPKEVMEEVVEEVEVKEVKPARRRRSKKEEEVN